VRWLGTKIQKYQVLLGELLNVTYYGYTDYKVNAIMTLITKFWKIKRFNANIFNQGYKL